MRDLTGQVFGRLTVIGRAENSVRGEIRWKCICDCGKEYTVRSGSLCSGNTKSCGCLKIYTSGLNNLSHGMRGHRAYKIWRDMKRRCNNEKRWDYKYYGGRGIGYDAAWEHFEGFWEDMAGSYSEGLSLDRIDNSLGYSKENCRWVVWAVQCRNKRKREGTKNPFIGVKKTKSGKFCVLCTIGGKNTSLGTYPTEMEAALVYDNTCEELGLGRPNKTLSPLNGTTKDA